MDIVRTKTESIDHLVSGCPILTPIEYKERQDKIEQDIHWIVGTYYGILDCEKWYKHQPEPITGAKGVTILQDFTI